MKYLSLLLILSLALSSCEVDDICTQDVQNPRLVLSFYDLDNPSVKKTANELYVWAEAKDSLYKNQNLDSIALPLDITKNELIYLIESTHTVDTLHVFYKNNEVFLSRSCGYIYNFELEETTNLTQHWTSGFEFITDQQINNETQTHIKVYH
jgi:hypothetical protein